MSFEQHGRIFVEDRVLERLAVKSNRPTAMSEGAFLDALHEEFMTASERIPKGLSMQMTIHPKGYVRCELKLRRAQRRIFLPQDASEIPF